MTDNRCDTRTSFRAGVKLTHEKLGELLLKTRDMSHSGAFLSAGQALDIHIGDRVSIQSTDIDDAPIIQAEIVRIESSGFAVRYLED